jgi:type II secretory pathway pseudopilin PulG
MTGVNDRRRWAPFSLERIRGERGSSLIEILVGISLMVGVMGSLMGPMLGASHSQIRDANYAAAQDSARAGLDRMVAEIRQATAILASGPNFVEMNVSLGGTSLVVQYECDLGQAGTAYRECLRVQAPAGSSLPAMSTGRTMITNLIGGTTENPVFSWGPDPVAPYYMTATIAVPASGGNALGLTHSIVFSDGALMRNLNVGN